MRPWECPRCGVMNAPHTERCVCKPTAAPVHVPTVQLMCTCALGGMSTNGGCPVHGVIRWNEPTIMFGPFDRCAAGGGIPPGTWHTVTLGAPGAES